MSGIVEQKWKAVRLTEGVLYSVPERAGLYAILRIQRAIGLPTYTEVVSFGASENLRNHLCPAI